MHSLIPHAENSANSDRQICGAKTRDGSPCQTPLVIGRKRCRMHGGTAKRGAFHHRFKHGRYSYGLGGTARSRDIERIERKRRREGHKRIAAFVAAFQSGDVRAVERTATGRLLGLERSTLRMLMERQEIT